MFVIGLLIGLYSYILFFLGLVGNLTKTAVAIVSVFFFALSLMRLFFLPGTVNFREINRSGRKNTDSLSPAGKAALILLAILAFVNFFGVIGPELSFDALWYHLTIPKLYLLHQKIYYIPGGLLYYSAMPKLIDLLYIPSLLFFNETGAKLTQFAFGIFSTAALYMLSRRYFTVTISLVICLIFYGNIVVAWESTVAYIDLGRTFYEVLALWAFMIWYGKQDKKWFYISALMTGFAVTAKLLAIGTLIIFTVLIIQKMGYSKKIITKTLSLILAYWAISFLVVLPWILFSYFNTGNPVFPFFSSYNLGITSDIFSPVRFMQDAVRILLFADDPLSPVYFIALPLVIFLYGKFRTPIKIIFLYSVLSFLIWYFTPRTGGGRFILPYLPAFSIITGEVIKSSDTHRYLRTILITIVFIISVVTIVYRGIANSRYIPVFLGVIAKEQFLTEHLNFAYGDFYDTDNYFIENIKPNDTVLLYGFHNLYYADFPYIHSSWVKKGDRFNYVAVQHTSLPERFSTWQRIYMNSITGVELYTSERNMVVY